MINQTLADENRELRSRINRLEDTIERQEAHIELQRAEIMALRDREKKSGELKEIFEKPKSKQIKSFTIDNRNEG